MLIQRQRRSTGQSMVQTLLVVSKKEREGN